MANDKPISYVESVRSRGIDGVVIASVDFEAPAVIELAKSGIPVVTIDYVYNGCTAILSDNDNGVASLVEYAYRLGHRKIAFIHAEPDHGRGLWYVVPNDLRPQRPGFERLTLLGLDQRTA